MTGSSSHAGGRVVFFSDAHLGLPGDSPERSQRVAAFLRSLADTTSHLYIVGDLFDFWFEYRTAVPNTAPEVVFELYNLRRSGTKITMFAGNHDYWLGPYFSEHVGVEFVPDGRIVEHQGKKMYLHHGDGLYPHDHGYRLLKKCLRSRTAITLFRLIHPDVAHWIAKVTSHTSRNYIAPSPVEEEPVLEMLRSAADEHLSRDCDVVVFGHCHIPRIEDRPAGQLILLGDWLRHYSYVALENGRFTLHTWNGKDIRTHHDS